MLVRARVCVCLLLVCSFVCLFACLFVCKFFCLVLFYLFFFCFFCFFLFVCFFVRSIDRSFALGGPSYWSGLSFSARTCIIRLFQST